MKKICVLGHFGKDETLLNGQTVKTKIITKELDRRFTNSQVMKIDTHGGIKTLIKAPFQIMKALKNSKNVVILPAQNGLRVYAPLLSIAKHFFKGRKLHYLVIGGWLPGFLSGRKLLAKSLLSFDGIYVETNTMKKSLEKQGYKNVFVMPNCKELTPLSVNELVYPSGMPYKLCTFSRVMKEKGIEDAIEAVRTVNESLGKIAYTLDIYGQVDSNQTEWFDSLQKKFPPYVQYGGLVPFDKSVEVLKDYFALLFPTHFKTEGIPGTIIDAYAAGVPVISAKWESYNDIVEDMRTGIGFKINDNAQFQRVVLKLIKSPSLILDMKTECICAANKYLPKYALDVFVDKLA